MAQNIVRFWQRSLSETAHVLSRPLLLAMLPAICIGLYWGFGETAVVALALLLPPLVFVMRATAQNRERSRHDVSTGLMSRSAFGDWAQDTFVTCKEEGMLSALFKVEIDEHETLIDRYGQATVDEIMLQVSRRVGSTFRANDGAVRLGDFTFAVCLHPVRNLDLEICIQLAGRLQQAVEEPVSVDGMSVYVTACVGFCQSSRVLNKSSQDWLDAAAVALRDAQSHGPTAIRAYSEEMRQRVETLSELRDEVIHALENGEIQPWYQPQISTDTGLVTGFEALARWHHPTRGMIAPSEFLPVIEQAGLLERLAEVMMFHAFKALKDWDRAGVVVPQVGVNFAGPELNDPKLVDKVMWELDRFDLTPDRLAVEVLETVVASAPDDVISRNINGLSKLGCKIDLDDFGTGHASITSIRRFAVSRIKIDRSFVMKADRDPEQQRMVSAILTMAERLDVETLAEGVETVGEHALLAQLGCNHVQGFGIAKPMPFSETIDWIAAHNAKLEDAPRIMGNRMR
jgi:diguanylate cyclase (GGDEF)-like protein